MDIRGHRISRHRASPAGNELQGATRNYRSSIGGRRLSVISGCLVAVLPQLAQADAVLTPNQISGVLEVVSDNPEIVEILGTKPATWSRVWATSVATTPPLLHRTDPVPDGAAHANYQLTVESSAAGIAYDVHALIYIQGGDIYRFGRPRTSPVQPEPAADVVADLRECAGVVDVHWVDGGGQPLAVSGGRIRVRTDDFPYYAPQADVLHIASGSTSRPVLVHGDGSLYDLDIFYDSGSDASRDRVRGLCSKQVAVSCDEIVPVTCVVPTGNGALGSISGTVDMLGEVELPVGPLTRVWAFNGPFGNQRDDRLNTAPASGSFSLPNLMPSGATADATGYMVRVELILGQGHDAEYWTAPQLHGSYNGGTVLVEAGQDSDLGDRFVMAPGEISGSIRLRGPVGENARHWLDSLSFWTNADDETDVPEPYWDVRSVVSAVGTTEVAPGTPWSTTGAMARVGFEGAYEASAGNYDGGYRLRVAGLAGAAGYWRTPGTWLDFRRASGGDESGDFIQSVVYVYDQALNDSLLVHPGERVQVDREYCLSEVEVGFATTDGTFRQPLLRGSGSLSELSGTGTMQTQHLQLQKALGTPTFGQPAATTGKVKLVLPQGQYDLRPEVQAVNPNGTASVTQLPPLPLQVGCRQTIKVATDLQISVRDMPSCPAVEEMTLEGSVTGALPIDSITFVNNGDATESVCTDCGEHPQFDHTFAPDSCENDLVVTATDRRGNTASVSASVNDDIAPQLSSCPDITRRAIATGDPSMFVDFDLSATDSCQEVAAVDCDIPSGSFFPYGTTRVHCQADDGCGNTTGCEFDVTILRQEDPGDPNDPNDPEVPDDPVDPEDPGECTEDDAQPVAFCSVAKATLWPPNHELVAVGLDLSRAYECSNMTMEAEGDAFDVAVEVWSDEPEEHEPADGSGNHAPDAKFDDGLRLRKERDGSQDGRVYLLRSVAESVSGSERASCCAVVVPHDIKPSSIDNVHRQARQALTHCGMTGEPPLEYFRHGLSAEVGPKQ